jgi:hypothetical protein
VLGREHVHGALRGGLYAVKSHEPIIPNGPVFSRLPLR